MIDNALHRKISKMLRKQDFENASEEKQLPTTKQGPENSYPDMAITKLTGYEKAYEKQIPVIASGKKPNMEMAKKLPQDKHGQQYGLLMQSQLGNFSGGSEPNELDTEDQEIEEVQLRRQMGAGKKSKKVVNDPEEYLQSQRLGGKKPAEVLEGSVVLAVSPPVMKPKRGRKPKEVAVIEAEPVQVVAGAKPTMKRRAEKIKEVMKAKQLTMIQASKYIKENKVSY